MTILSTQNHIKVLENVKSNWYEILTDILTHLAKCNKIQKQIKDIHKIKETEYKVNGMDDSNRKERHKRFWEKDLLNLTFSSLSFVSSSSSQTREDKK